jgi:hypothetical protein
MPHEWARPRTVILSAASFCLVGALAGSTSSIAQASRALEADVGATSPSEVGGCDVFPATNYWNTPVDDLEVDSHSAAWLSHMSPGSTLHPDFGKSYGEQPVPYGIPITVVDGDHARVDVRFQYDDESDAGPYPLGEDTKFEGGRRSKGDRHVIVVDSSTCDLYETWHTKFRKGKWSAGSGAIWDLDSHQLRPDGWTSADAAGLPILPGLLRLDEVKAGLVTHAIRFTTDQTQTAHIWPARHDAGSTGSANYPPMGARFRLDADFPTTSYRHDTVVVLKAMKKYGLVLADNGSPWYFQGTAEKGWPSALLDELKSIPANAFEAVDTAPMMIDPDSGEARQP